jgi:hypothetical protein
VKSNLVVITCLWQRPEVASLVLARLRAQGMRVVAVGSEGDVSRKLAESHGARYIEHENQPLGAKWNRALRAAQAFAPLGVVVLGSDNMVNDWLFELWAIALCHGFEYIGLLDGYIYDKPTDRLIHWTGYTRPKRVGEPLGSSRCFSGALLDRLDWRLWVDEKRTSLDYSATQRLKAFQPRTKFLTMGESGAKHLGIKTDCSMGGFTHFLENVPHAVRHLDPALLDTWFGPEIRNKKEVA